MFTSEACDMNATVNDPDLHLQCFNDYGIFTIDELNLLSKTVKPQLSALHLNVRSRVLINILMNSKIFLILYPFPSTLLDARKLLLIAN